MICYAWYDTKTMYVINDTRFNSYTCLKGYVEKWYDMKENEMGLATVAIPNRCLATTALENAHLTKKGA